MSRPRSHPIWRKAADVCALYECGMTLREVGRVYDCQYWQVRDVLIDNGVTLRPGRKKGPEATTPWKVRKIVQWRRANKTWAQIGELLGMSGPGALKLAKRWETA